MGGKGSVNDSVLKGAVELTQLIGRSQTMRQTI